MKREDNNSTHDRFKKLLKKIGVIFYNIILIFTFEEKNTSAYSINIRIPKHIVTTLKAYAFLGLILYFLNSAFCIFEDKVPLGKMQEELVVLSHKANDVLISKGYCNNYGNCAYKDIFFTRVTCDGISFKFYNINGLEIPSEVESEIIAGIAKYSTFTIKIIFRNEKFEPCFFCIPSKPKTEVIINRKKL